MSVTKLRIKRVETPHDKFSVFLILGKYDRFAEPVTAVDFDTTLHQVLQNCINRSFIEHKFVQCCRGDKIGNIAILGKIVLITLLVLIGKIIVGDTFFKKFCLYFIIIIRHKHMIGMYSRFVIIGISRNTILDFKEIICVAVNISFRCSCQTDHDRIKILKDSTIFLKNAPVALVRDNKIEVCRRKQRHAVLCLCAVNNIEYCGISRKHYTGISVVLVTA